MRSTVVGPLFAKNTFGVGTGVRRNARFVPLSRPTPTIWPVLLIAVATRRSQPVVPTTTPLRFCGTSFVHAHAYGGPPSMAYPTITPSSLMPLAKLGDAAPGMRSCGMAFRQRTACGSVPAASTVDHPTASPDAFTAWADARLPLTVGKSVRLPA